MLERLKTDDIEQFTEIEYKGKWYVISEYDHTDVWSKYGPSAQPFKVDAPTIFPPLRSITDVINIQPPKKVEENTEITQASDAQYQEKLLEVSQRLLEKTFPDSSTTIDNQVERAVTAAEALLDTVKKRSK